MFDKYHLTTVETLKKLNEFDKTVTFELFFRNPGEKNFQEETLYISRNFEERVRKTIEKVNKFYKGYIEVDDIKIAGLPNKEIVEVRPRFPLVQITGKPSVILYESALINTVQLELIYTTRLYKIKKIAEEMGIFAVADFGLRRAPGLEAANLFSELAIEMGFYTSNMNLYNKHPEMVIGTLPHAFIQIVTEGNEDAEKYLWDRIFEMNKEDSSIPDTVLPDTYNFNRTVAYVLENAKKDVIKIRVDSGDFIEAVKYIRDCKKSNRIKEIHVILSGDIDESKLKELKERGLMEIVKESKIPMKIGVAIGTQVVNNIKPLSITYKVVEVNGKEVTKSGAKGKGYIPGKTYVEVKENKFELKSGSLPKNYKYTYVEV